MGTRNPDKVFHHGQPCYRCGSTERYKSSPTSCAPCMRASSIAAQAGTFVRTRPQPTLEEQRVTRNAGVTRRRHRLDPGLAFRIASRRQAALTAAAAPLLKREAKLRAASELAASRAAAMAAAAAGYAELCGK